MAKPPSVYKEDFLKWTWDPLKDVQLTKTQKDRALDKIIDVVEEQFFDAIASGKSPVSGEGRFKGLTSAYRKKKRKLGKAGRVNMELFGNMLQGVRIKKAAGEFISISVRKNNAEKADGHSRLTERRNDKLPRRRFIPGEDQSLIRSIKKEVREIIEEASRGKR